MSHPSAKHWPFGANTMMAAAPKHSGEMQIYSPANS
jgi:hypothetical protein